MSILNEAFKKLSYLTEETFDLQDKQEIKDMEDVIDTTSADETVDVIDLEADNETEIKDSYIGKVILECPICKNLVFSDTNKITIDDNDTQLVNVGDECPTCYSTDGFVIVGEVQSYNDATVETQQEEKDIPEEEPKLDTEDEEPTDVSEAVATKSPSVGKILKQHLKELNGIYNSKELGNKAIEIVNASDASDENKQRFANAVLTSGVNGAEKVITAYITGTPAIGRKFNHYEGYNNKQTFKSIKEDFNKLEVKTKGNKIELEIVSEGNQDQDNVDQPHVDIVAPVAVETAEKIENNPENIKYDIDEFDEESFDKLSENYFKKVYENVASFKTTNVNQVGSKLVVEGVIGFTSGVAKKTSFILEAKDAGKNGRARFLGENKELTPNSKSFVVFGKVSDKKFVAESLRYNYIVENSRVHGSCNVNRI